MTESVNDSDAGLKEFLASRARHASDTRLALDVGVGFVAAIIAVVWRGPAWFLVAAAAMVFVSYGTWGIADRELSTRAAEDRTVRSLRAARTVSAAVGLAATLALVLGVFTVAFGTVKS